MIDRSRLLAARDKAQRALLDARDASGHWTGELSSSALSTATAVCALSIVEREGQGRDSAIRYPHSVIERGLDWLAAHANADGGWGDTTLSLSNLSTTALCWAAFGIVPGADEKYRATVQAAERWLVQKAGGMNPEKLVPAIVNRYGKDRTFSVPILMTCALAGKLGPLPGAWRHVLQLPFELAAMPHQFFAALRLPVVSYALPALIAIGQARHFHRPTLNPLTRGLRNLTRDRTLAVLTEIQPDGGGFLEATPLTSFVTMALASSGLAEHEVTRLAVDFLLKSVRADGSWPIDTNLATWVTTLSVNALAAGGEMPLPEDERARIRDWLLAQQYRVEHPYTHAAPGGWAWTDLPGGVPDADDTAGALLALKNLGDIDARTREAAIAGVKWLLDLQNSDGGIPTFCRGWTNLPFDRSGPDLTAHAMRAWLAWRDELMPALQKRVNAATDRALSFLWQAQRSDGSWVPLWFGNQFDPAVENPAYGTARVLFALQELAYFRFGPVDGTPSTRFVKLPEPMQYKGQCWLLAAQNPDGSWSVDQQSPPSVEETSLAVESMANLIQRRMPMLGDVTENESAAQKGAEWLVRRVEDGTWTQPAPIGFYFAKLWYYERLYPMIFTVGALNRVAKLLPSS
jgi:squalene-hopene/tetraprenyl-beta-curcumene cyclase